MVAAASSVLHIGAHAPHSAQDKCPWCEQPVSHSKFAEITERIATKEREQHELVTSKLKADFLREKAEAEARARAEVKAQIEAEVASRLQLADEARVAAEAALSQQKELLEKERTVAVLAEQAKAFEEKQKLQEKLMALQKQLENKTAQEIGEGPEVDLFEQLRGAFEGDRIRRVQKGAQGVDVIHEVMRNGQVAGKIVYDSKSRNAWKNEYVLKLRADQLAERAEHAVLSCNKMPSGAQQLHVQDGVIIAHPGRIVVLAEILRRHILETFDLRLSNDRREDKTAELYAFITSDRCKQLLEQIERETARMVELDVAEEKAHRLTWERRSKLIKTVQKVHGDLCFEIERVIGGAEEVASSGDETGA